MFYICSKDDALFGIVNRTIGLAGAPPRQPSCAAKSQGKPTSKPRKAKVACAKSQPRRGEKPTSEREKAKESQAKPRKANPVPLIAVRRIGRRFRRVRMSIFVHRCLRLLTRNGGGALPRN
jgi:hypothetical protein